MAGHGKYAAGCCARHRNPLPSRAAHVTSAIVALKVVDDAGTLARAGMECDLLADPPIIVNGVVFAMSRGTSGRFSRALCMSSAMAKSSGPAEDDHVTHDGAQLLERDGAGVRRHGRQRALCVWLRDGTEMSV